MCQKMIFLLIIFGLVSQLDAFHRNMGSSFFGVSMRNKQLYNNFPPRKPLQMAWSTPFKILTFRSLRERAQKTYKMIALYCVGDSLPIISDETYEEWLDDIIYSGDIEGYIKRKSIDFVNEDFLGYLQERQDACMDNDEKSVIHEIILAIEAQMKQTDGLGDSDLVYEKKLDQLLFVAPQKRREAVQESLNEMTPGFISYIQSEIKKAEDSDVKVVLASLLQMIGQSKNEDYLSNSELKLPSSLTDSAKTSLDLTGNIKDLAAPSKIGGANPSNLDDAYFEQILAGLVFSSGDVLEDVLNNLHYINDGFVKFLEKKVEKAGDLEERMGLSSLLDTVNTVLAKVKDVQGENAIDVNNEELTMDQVKQRLKDVQMGRDVELKKNEYATLWDYELKSNKRETFLGILNRFQNLPETVSLETVVEANYELCDLQFMESLKEEIASCYAEGADIEGQQYQTLMETINKVMVKRVAAAQEKLARILTKPSPKAMETEIVAMVRKGEVDEALILLLEGNIQQAEQAGATDAVKVLRTLSKRITEEKERKLPDEQRLLRALMRESDSEKRKALLYEAFKPSKSLNDDGGVVQGPPLISPPSFINVARRVMQESGNIEGFQIMDRMLKVVDEAEVVATELYGEGMTPREQQSYMFHKNSMSVWDLAKMEEEAMMTGDSVPWANPAYDDKMPEDVLQERRVKQIGGMDGM